MHVQAKAVTTGSAFADEDGDENNTAVSATYSPGAVLGILDILQREGFNLRTATGQRIELGGEFGFTVDPRNSNEDFETATAAAVAVSKSSLLLRGSTVKPNSPPSSIRCPVAVRRLKPSRWRMSRIPSTAPGL